MEIGGYTKLFCSRDTTSLWLKLLLDDQRSIRCMANQAMEGILKLEKVPSRKVPLKELLSLHPGNKRLDLYF
jgi:hypothetical protein